MNTVPDHKCIIPFWGSIPGGLRVGKIIEIRGYIPPGANVFDVNFMTSRDDGSKQAERPLHISVRPSDKVVVRNVLKSGKWGTEERNEDFPFAFNNQFLLMVLVETHGYKIAVNCKHYWEFTHRLPFVSVTMLHISGTVRIDEIRYREPFWNQVISPYGLQRPTNFSLAEPVLNPPIPYFYPLTEGLRSGQMIFISGRPTASARRFTVNLSCSNTPYPPPDDIAFHFDSRMYCSTLVRNTCVNEKWGKEETSSPYFPFFPGVHFDMIFNIQNDKFMVALNGQHFLEYRHRIFPILKINSLSILGDLVISSVRCMGQ